MVQLMRVKDNKHYYERLVQGVELSMLWDSLQTKAEVWCGRSEKGYQNIAQIMAGNIARGLGLNANLAEILTMCRGTYFPAYGAYGKQVILQYMREHGLEMPEADLARNYIEFDLNQCGNIITPEFDQYLQELFDESKEPVTPEIKVARLCHKTLDIIKRQDAQSQKPGDFFALTKDVENFCIQTGQIAESPKLQELLRTVPEYNISPDDPRLLKLKEKICKSLSEFIGFAEEPMDGIYDYFGFDEQPIQ